MNLPGLGWWWRGGESACLSSWGPRLNSWQRRFHYFSLKQSVSAFTQLAKLSQLYILLSFFLNLSLSLSHSLCLSLSLSVSFSLFLSLNLTLIGSKHQQNIASWRIKNPIPSNRLIEEVHELEDTCRRLEHKIEESEDRNRDLQHTRSGCLRVVSWPWSKCWLAQ